jgi:hypothetical protein
MAVPSLPVEAGSRGAARSVHLAPLDHEGVNPRVTT